MSPEVSIHHALKALVPNLALGCISANVAVEKYNEALWRKIDQHLAHLIAIKPEQINTVPQIAAMRSAYKALGKAPSRYRGSAERSYGVCFPAKGFTRSTAWWTSTTWTGNWPNLFTAKDTKAGQSKCLCVRCGNS